jgi:hypothetical protein
MYNFGLKILMKNKVIAFNEENSKIKKIYCVINLKVVFITHCVRSLLIYNNNYALNSRVLTCYF